MARKVILFIAQSLDGYIARTDGSIDFLEFNRTHDDVDDAYDRLMAGVDTVVMGRTTYDQVVNELSPDVYPYVDQESYILTTHLDQPAIPQRHFVNMSVVDLVQQLKNQPGKDIWIIGGSSLLAPLINADLIDSYQITIVPVLIDSGIPLFTGAIDQHVFQLQSAHKVNNFAYLTYLRTDQHE
ncbi:dihydrofolate reductase [Lapidilactobacillus dextrinicus DSM 20335]|uniref:Dihydrofolate reductase n=1 Tax=Lapidilactobacillus dextrinicus DSM 20335 TaxID=1423738 RepID=A0A0R2BFD5_9LACO|nr:dihydrofolate reductase family protein [Lapidilactobacillus dextrinicus]KRM78351.1 dihydrofolate reductase [Lapidilactobacillus dextrinicus DSM 20335]QFG47343.1 dihydrofolate reductase [Lapidilactobacillus dextrinicus]